MIFELKSQHSHTHVSVCVCGFMAGWCRVFAHLRPAKRHVYKRKR